MKQVITNINDLQAFGVKRLNLFSNNIDIGPNETMIEHECPYWSPCNSHVLLKNQ